MEYDTLKSAGVGLISAEFSPNTIVAFFQHKHGFSPHSNEAPNERPPSASPLMKERPPPPTLWSPRMFPMLS